VRNLDSDDRNRKLQLSRGENQYSIVHKPLRPQGRGMNSKYFFPPNVSCLPQVIQLECNCINHNNIAKSVVLLFLCLYKFCLQASLHIVIQSISCPAMTLHPSANYCEINSVCPWIYKGRNGCLQQLTLGHMPSHFTTIFLEFPPPCPRYPSQELTWHPSKYVFLWTVKWEREGQKLTIDFVFHGYIGMKDTERADKFSKFNNTILLHIKQIKHLQKQKGSPMSQTKKSRQMTRDTHLKNITRVALQSILHSKGTASGTQLIQTSCRWWSSFWHQQKVTLTQVYTNIYWNDSAHPVCKQVLLLVFE
jgi:hypothetical protein